MATGPMPGGEPARMAKPTMNTPDTKMIHEVSRIDLQPNEVLAFHLVNPDPAELQGLTSYLNQTPLKGRYLFIDSSTQLQVISVDGED